jgi:hypothetical protein
MIDDTGEIAWRSLTTSGGDSMSMGTRRFRTGRLSERDRTDIRVSEQLIRSACFFSDERKAKSDIYGFPCVDTKLIIRGLQWRFDAVRMLPARTTDNGKHH